MVNNIHVCVESVFDIQEQNISLIRLWTLAFLLD